MVKFGIGQAVRRVEDQRFLAPDCIRFSARADSSPRPLWFYFEIHGATVPAVRLELANADQCLGPRLGWRLARPVYRAAGGTWERVTQAEYVEESGRVIVGFDLTDRFFRPVGAQVGAHDTRALLGEAQRRRAAHARAGARDHCRLSLEQHASHSPSCSMRLSAPVGHASTAVRIASMVSPAGSTTIAFVCSSCSKVPGA